MEGMNLDHAHAYWLQLQAVAAVSRALQKPPTMPEPPSQDPRFASADARRLRDNAIAEAARCLNDAAFYHKCMCRAMSLDRGVENGGEVTSCG
jgi:hypothetical protein